MYEACLLHSRADRALKYIVSKQLEKWKMTRMEWLLLGSVERAPKVSSGHTMGELAQILDIKLSQLTALITGLTENKYVTQKIASHDKRTRYISITNKGKNILDDIEIDMRDSMQKWLGDIPKEQLEIYMQTVSLIAVGK
jgi:DNA-binding MarR family transcriptional regulator